MMVTLTGKLTRAAISIALLIVFAAAQAQGNSQTLTVRAFDNLLTLDPAHITSGTDYSVAILVYSGLVRHIPGTTVIEGDLARSWEIADDGLSYTFHLHENVLWHGDFGELTATDVVYSFERLMDPDEGSRYRGDVSPLASVEAIDDYTVRFNLHQPYPAFFDAVLAYRPGLIVNRAAIEQYGDAYTNSPIGTGPYVFDGWTPGSQIRLVRNDAYYGATPEIQEVVLQIIREDSIAAIALETGELDAAYIDEPEVQARVTANSNFTIVERPMPRIWFLTLNPQREWAEDARVRQAIAHAINKELIVSSIFSGMGEVAHTIVAPTQFGFLDEPGRLYDLEVARQLLADAGHPGGLSGPPLEIVSQSSGVSRQLAEVVQAMLVDIGIESNLVAVERGLYESRKREGNFDLSIEANLRVEPSQTLMPHFHSSLAPFPNISNYSGADAWLDLAIVEVDEAQRAFYYQEAQRRIIEDVPAVPLLFPVQVLALQPNVEGGAIGLLTYPVWQMRKVD